MSAKNERFELVFGDGGGVQSSCWAVVVLGRENVETLENPFSRGKGIVGGRWSSWMSMISDLTSLT